MNNQLILHNLREAQEELQGLIVHIESEEDFCFEEYQVSMSHVYHHLNTAWNARHATDKQWKECSRQSFEKWRQFPSDGFVF